MLLGKSTSYPSQYNSNWLVSIPRDTKRLEVGISSSKLPFVGYDIWNAYEISWLNLKGKPQVALARFLVPCETDYIIESKSLKLYLNSFNNTKFDDINEVQGIIKRDLSAALKHAVEVEVFPYDSYGLQEFSKIPGVCIDNLDIEVDTYHINSKYLTVESEVCVEENLYSNLLKSNCLVTRQPDWATINIKYKGAKLDRAGLLKYIISYRDHDEFHEQCIERIFMDILNKCDPESLMVAGYYTRRGGLDINPIRSNNPSYLDTSLFRYIRQ